MQDTAFREASYSPQLTSVQVPADTTTEHELVGRPLWGRAECLNLDLNSTSAASDCHIHRTDEGKTAKDSNWGADLGESC